MTSCSADPHRACPFLRYIDAVKTSLSPLNYCALLPFVVALALALPACEQGPVEICGDGADNDGDGGYDCADSDCAGTEDCPDNDGDRFATEESGGLDCNDDNPNIHPAATEVCDGIDNDCHGVGDEGAVDATTWYGDYDYDGYGGTDFIEESCEPIQGHVSSATDCDDYDETVHPDATELCDGKDNDCDGATDEDGNDLIWYGDADGDGYGGSQFLYQGCDEPEGYVDNNQDCDDLNPDAYPGAAESCGGADFNCDGIPDTGGVDNDLDGQAGCEGDCNDDEPAVNGLDLDGDGVASCDGDCDDLNPLAASIASDADCDGVDSNVDCDDLNSSIGACGACLGSYSLDETDTAGDLTALSSCLTIEGNLEITATTLTDLSPLSVLSAVGGTVIIWNNAQLSDLVGLSNLISIGGTLLIWDNPSLCQSAVIAFTAACTIAGSVHTGGNDGC